MALKLTLQGGSILRFSVWPTVYAPRGLYGPSVWLDGREIRGFFWATELIRVTVI